MSKKSIKPPSSIQFVTFPIFAITWHATNSKNIIAYCGGGGSAKTGVGNSIRIQITPNHKTTSSLSDDFSSTNNAANDCQSVTIDTGTEIGTALAIYQPQGVEDFVWLVAGIGNTIRLYSLHFHNNHNHSTTTSTDENSTNDVNSAGNECVTLLHTEDLGENYGANTVAFNSVGTAIAVGCENGILCIFDIIINNDDTTNSTTTFLTKAMDLQQHIKAICSISFHPRNIRFILSSAKDGTCIIWDLKRQQPMDILQCKIYEDNGNGKLPTNPNILNPKPGQLLVRGCAFGDLEGQLIYTVQSGRKGGAFFSVWRVAQVPDDTTTIDPSSNNNNTPKFKIIFQEVSRKQVSPYPVSAMSLSGDFQTLALGDTNGTISLLSTHPSSFCKVLKSWESIHDLPVTCITARPTLSFDYVDAISASADNRLAFVTKQTKVKMKKKVVNHANSTNKSHSGKSKSLFRWFSSILSYLIVLLSILAGLKVSFDACESEIMTIMNEASNSNFRHEALEDALQCVWHGVWWADKNRVGVAFVPH